MGTIGTIGTIVMSALLGGISAVTLWVFFLDKNMSKEDKSENLTLLFWHTAIITAAIYTVLSNC